MSVFDTVAQGGQYCSYHFRNYSAAEGTFVQGGGLEIPCIYDLIWTTREKDFCVWRSSNKFGNFQHKVRSFFSSGRLIEAVIFQELSKKIAIFNIQIRGWAFIRAWASNRDFTVCGYPLLSVAIITVC